MGSTESTSSAVPGRVTIVSKAVLRLTRRATYGSLGAACVFALAYGIGAQVPGPWNFVASLDWSPDGKSLLVVGFQGARKAATAPAMHIVEVDGRGGARLLKTPGLTPTHAVFDMSGRSVVFSGRQRNRSGIFRLDLGSGRVSELTTGKSDTRPVMVRGAKESILFIRGSVVGGTAVRRDLITGTETELPLEGILMYLKPSPDGTRLVVVRADDELGGGVYTASIDGSAASRLAAHDRATWPDWFPDGQSIVYSVGGQVPKHHTIYRYQIRTGQKQELVRKGFLPRISASANRIAFFTTDEALSLPGTALYVANLDGSAGRLILK